mgnify:CR=1 FL=1
MAALPPKDLIDDDEYALTATTRPDQVEPQPQKTDAKTDAWQRADIVAKAVGSLLLPVVVFWLGQHYANQQRDIEAQRRQQEAQLANAERKADRAATFLKHLASENESERILAVKMLEHLSGSGQFPSELLPALIETVNDKKTRVAKAASSALATAVSRDDRVAKSITNAVKSSEAGTKRLRVPPLLNRG